MLALSSCTVVGNVTQLDDDYYRLIRRESPDSLVAALQAKKDFYVQQRADTLLLTPPSGAALLTYRYRLQPNQRVVLLRRRLDVDVFTIPFKMRPSQGSVPVQLNTNFNAAIYLGRRLDFYALRTKRSTPFGATPHVRATGIGYGAFVGVGSTVVNPDVTRQRATIADYEGLVVHGGLAAIYDARAFNIGVAVGADQLLGPDGPHWVYRRKPWFGVLFGLDLN
ncbi:hypothetical protein BEN47_08020 [Hymenobacter lapidarius]|uniref:Uncharacterized protein n=2 Tax=Hymenobacter lapidarius TaxID=1908237 RepID=A0A1G1TDW2_9BACT|nr:hypothetical protein BEN47_08020 [Hymenobacter lapidarius]